MHYFFSSHGKPTIFFLVRGIVVTLFWPFAALHLIVNFRRSSIIDNDDETKQLDLRLDSLRYEIETIAFANGNAASVFEFREIFSRYVGLVRADLREPENGPANEIFQLSGHSDPKLATRCLERIATIRVSSHTDNARIDFINLVASLTKNASSKILRSAIETANLLNDEQTVSRLHDLAELSIRPKINGNSPESLFAPESIRVVVN